jgi:hypothetical protein
LYHYNETIRNIYASEQHIVIKDSSNVYWLLNFQHSFTSTKESLQLENKTKLFDGNLNGWCLFEYPFLSFANTQATVAPMLIDVRTGIDLLNKNKIQIPN